VLNYRSYPQIKLGIRFWTTLYISLYFKDVIQDASIFLQMYLLNSFSRQIKVSIKNYEISFGNKYSVRDLIYAVYFCAWAAM